jgi:hypothetical protein
MNIIYKPLSYDPNTNIRVNVATESFEKMIRIGISCSPFDVLSSRRDLALPARPFKVPNIEPRRW